MADVLRIAGREFQSRLFVGTGKYRSFQEMARCHSASGAEVATVAVRREGLVARRLADVHGAFFVHIPSAGAGDARPLVFFACGEPEGGGHADDACHLPCNARL